MLKQVALIALMGMSASAMAGQFQVKVGGSVISPTQDTAVAGVGVVKGDDELAFTPSVEYFFNDNFSAELLLATPIGHDILLDGEKAAKVKHLPPVITAKYHFKNSTRLTPYIGVGAAAFIAFDEQSSGALAGTDIKVKEDYGVIGSAKATYSIEHDSITITAIEDGKKLEDCKVSYVSTEAKDYAFNVWSELS